MIHNDTQAKALAIAISRYRAAHEELLRRAGDRFTLDAMRERDRAEQDLRDAFRDITGWTLVYKRGRYGVRR